MKNTILKKNLTLKVIFLSGFLLLGFTNKLFSQDSLIIYFGDEYHISSPHSNGFMKLFKCTDDGRFIHYGKTKQIVFPENFIVKDTALALNYFTGWKNSITPNQVLFLIGNYSSFSPVVYVDYNQNLDFSDDGDPLVFRADTSAIVYLNNSEFTSAQFPIKLYYPNLNPKLKGQVKSILGSTDDALGNDNVDVDYWFADKRMNLKVSYLVFDEDSLKIGIYDYNCNGLYNDLGFDRITISDSKNNPISIELNQGAVVYTDDFAIKVGNQVYEIQEIEASGKYIKLKKSEEKYLQPIKLGSDISDLNLKLLTEEITTIQHIQEHGKYLLIDFWGTWCKGCTQQLPALKKLVESNKDKLQVIGMSFGDTKEQIESYVKKHTIKWSIGFADEDLIRKLRVDGFPTYMLLNKSGEILLMNGDLEQISKIIE